MLKRLLLILVLLVGFSTVGAKPAAACPPIPGISQVCELITGGTLLDAVKSRIQIYVETMLWSLRIESTKKYAETTSLLEQKGALATAHRDDERELTPSVQGVRCVLNSAMVVGIQGRVDAAPVDNGNLMPPSLSTTSTARAAMPPLPPNRDSSGNPLPNDKKMYDMDTSAYDFQSFTRANSEQAMKAVQDRLQNRGKGANDKYSDVRLQYAIRMANFGPEQPEKFRDADINANTLFQYDTFPGDTNTPKPGADNVAGTPITMAAAAARYCQNLTVPTILDPNRGLALAQDTRRGAYAVERSGWDARLMLAAKICQDSVDRRIGKDVATVGQAKGLVAIAQTYRADACRNDSLKTVLNCDMKAKFSEFEMMKNLYSNLLPSMQGAGILGSAGKGDTLYNLLSVDQMSVTLNFRIYEMQEKLALLKAAQLAQIVENTRSGPSASASRQ